MENEPRENGDKGTSPSPQKGEIDDRKKNVSSVVNAWKSYIDKGVCLSPQIVRVACNVCLIQRKFLKINVWCKRKRFRIVYS